jgi:hypothetical protein
VSDTRGSPGPATTGGELSQDERAELERLRSEVRTRRRRASWRAPIAMLLIIVGCLLAPVSVLAVWTADQVSDTNRYIENVEPLIHDPAVQGALTDKISNEITGALNVKSLTDQVAANLAGHGMTRASTLLTSVAPSIDSAINGFIHDQVYKVVTSPNFARTWVAANRVAHQELVTALSGRTGGAISTSNGQVTIDLAPFIAVVKQALDARGFTVVNRLPAVHPTLALFSDRYLVKAQTGYRLINDLKIVLPVLSLLLIAAGVFISRQHRRALVGAGLGFAASMVLLAAALAIFRAIYLNSVPSSVLPSDAAAALYDTLVRFIKTALRALLAAGLLVALGAFFTGPSVTATTTRRAFVSGFGWVRRHGELVGVRTGPVGMWVYAQRKPLRIVAVAIAAMIFAFSGQLTVSLAVEIVVVLLLVMGLIELIGRPSPTTAEAVDPVPGKRPSPVGDPR